ncbi:hypothetical protein GCM10022630_06060 [Thermobifida alba]
MGEDAGLARPRPGDDQQRTALVEHGGALGLVETFEKLLLGGHPTKGRRGWAGVRASRG